VGKAYAAASWRVTLTLAALTLACVPAGEPASSADVAPGWDDREWAVFEAKARWALASRLDTLPMGEAMAALGRTFVGTAYVPGSLEVEGPERVVVGFRGLDCVTFVENVLALSRFVRLAEASTLLERRGEAEDRYEALLTEVRYRDGVLDGYPSRLHYFSDWIADAEVKGLVVDVTEELGGVRDQEPVNFMTQHPDAYPPLSDAGNLASMRLTEERITERGRWYVPEARLDAATSRILNGDIIAATSTVRGLDVAHTGLALWVEGTLKLLHAPLVGDSVQVSEEALPQRIRRIRGQDGIIVARPTQGR
jgi:hypothetical protein